MKVMGRKANESRFIETFTAKEISITRDKTDSIHYDGEPDSQGTELKYTLLPKSLKVIVGDKFDGV